MYIYKYTDVYINIHIYIYTFIVPIKPLPLTHFDRSDHGYYTE